MAKCSAKEACFGKSEERSGTEASASEELVQKLAICAVMEEDLLRTASKLGS